MNELIVNLDEGIRSDFSSLWDFRARGETMEVITPYTLLSGECLSVFVTQRQDRYVVSDGARLFEIEAEQGVELSNRKGLHYDQMVQKFGIKETMLPGEDAVFRFKSTKSVESLTSTIYDVVNFSIALGNAIYLDTLFTAVDEDALRRFSTKVRMVLRDKIRLHREKNDRFEFFTDPDATLWQFNSGIRKVGTQDVWLGMTISRSNIANFRHSVQRAEFGFSHISSSMLAGEKKLHFGAVVDELPRHLLENKNVASLCSAMGLWNKFGVQQFSYRQFNELKDLNTLISPAA